MTSSIDPGISPAKYQIPLGIPDSWPARSVNFVMCAHRFYSFQAMIFRMILPGDAGRQRPEANSFRAALTVRTNFARPLSRSRC
jgi:hypothetical protein